MEDLIHTSPGLASQLLIVPSLNFHIVKMTDRPVAKWPSVVLVVAVMMWLVACIVGPRLPPVWPGIQRSNIAYHDFIGFPVAFGETLALRAVVKSWNSRTAGLLFVWVGLIVVSEVFPGSSVVLVESSIAAVVWGTVVGYDGGVVVRSLRVLFVSCPDRIDELLVIRCMVSFFLSWVLGFLSWTGLQACVRFFFLVYFFTLTWKC